MWLKGLAGAAVTTTAVATTAGVAAAVTVTVRPGDNLTRLAARYGTTVAALAAANGITDRGRVYAGERLTLPATAAPSTITVTVRRGDNLTGIAARYGTTVAALAAANHVTNPNVVRMGRQLAVPAGGGSAAAGGGPSAAAPGWVTVAPGDNLTGIAARYGTSAGALAAANRLSDPNRVLAGQHLVIPAGGAAPGWLPDAVLTDPARLQLRPAFRRWSAAYRLPTGLLEGLSWWESGWQSTVVSSTGAVGVGQLEPSTVGFVRTLIGDPTLKATVPEQNIHMSAAFLHHLLASTGDRTDLAVAAYYQGLASVNRRGMLPETRHYVTGVLNYARLFAR